MPNLAALRAAIFCYLRKTNGGGAHMCPPSRARVKLEDTDVSLLDLFGLGTFDVTF